MACEMVNCERLPLETGTKITRTQFLVCKYSPTFFRREDALLYREGPCSSSACPTDASSSCVPFGGDVGGEAENGGGAGEGLYCGKGIRFGTITIPTSLKGWFSNIINNP